MRCLPTKADLRGMGAEGSVQCVSQYGWEMPPSTFASSLARAAFKFGSMLAQCSALSARAATRR